MLLPIETFEQDRFRNLSYRRVALTNLFSTIRSGIAVTQETPRRVQLKRLSETGLRPVVFLRMQSILRFSHRIDWNVVKGDWRQEPLQAWDAPTLPEEEILREEDYLLNMRGMPYGMGLTGLYEDMPKELREVGLRLAAGNNFIRLRPNSEADCEPPFLHLLLDMLMSRLQMEYRHLGNPRSPQDIPDQQDDASEDAVVDPETSMKGSFIKVADLKGISLNIPERPEDRDVLMQEYFDLRKAQREASRKLNAFRYGFRQFIIPRKQN
jgi:hypothetical protein